jgi:tetratricopeptide (TPR) repeat protein
MDAVKPFAAFISHQHADSDWARRLTNALEARGLKVWLDRDRLLPGDILVEELQKAIEQCAAVVVGISPESVASPWVLQETSAAIELSLRSKVRVIPCVLREAEMPSFLASRVRVDFRNESDFDGAVESLVRAISGKAAASLVPEPVVQISRMLLPPPYPKPVLVGRDQVVQQVREALLAQDPTGPRALQGMPGVGKTAIALAVAFDDVIRVRFNQDVIWVQLGRQPDLLGLLGEIGGRLGIAGSEIAELTSVRERHLRIREGLASRPVLVIIDDAWSLEDALVFKLGGPGSAHLLTTRHRNIAVEFAETKVRVEPVQELSPKESLILLERYVPDLVQQSVVGCSESLAAAVGRLPLALIILGGYLSGEGATGQKSRLRRAIERLASAQNILEMHPPPGLDGMAISLWQTIQISYDALSDSSQRLLRSLAAFPPKPATFSEAAACAAGDCAVDDLNTLVDSGLVELTVPESNTLDDDRYTLQRAIDSFARQQLDEHREAPDVYRRMLTFFVELVDGHGRHGSGYKAIQHESENVCAVLRGAHGAGLTSEFASATLSLFGYLESLGHYEAAEDCLAKARVIVEAQGDTRQLGEILNASARIARKQGRYAQAEEAGKAGLRLAEAASDQALSCQLLGNLAGVVANLGRYREAIGYLDLAIARACRLDPGENLSTLLRQRGATSSNLGEFLVAEEFLLRGLAIATEQKLGNQFARISAFLGELEIVRGHYERAERYLEAGRERAEGVAYREVQCVCLQNFGTLEAKRGNDRKAERLLRKSLELARQMGHRERVTNALAELAWLKVEAGAWKEAARAVAEAKVIAADIGHAKRLSFLLILESRLDVAAERYDRAGEGLEIALRQAREMEHTPGRRS